MNTAMWVVFLFVVITVSSVGLDKHNVNRN